MTGILQLPQRIAELPADARQRLERIFSVSLLEGHTDPPPELHDWLVEHFGSVEAVRDQHIVRVINRWTQDGALFSPLRASRPHGSSALRALREEVEATRDDEFCHPETRTPADTWGRIRGRHAITGANAAKYDARHGLVIFDEHDPLSFEHDSVVDMLEVGRAWAERGRAEDPASWAYLLIWNAGPRAGGSIVHGHAQVLLGRDAHYPQVERLRRDAATYRHETGFDYFSDLVDVHGALGLAIADAGGVTTLASLAPVKERELLIIGQAGMDEREPAFADAVARAAVAYRDVLAVRAFNLALHRAPLDPDLAQGDGWAAMPPIVHLVDRGDPDSRSSDIGAMELYAAAVVGGDPFGLAATLRAALSG